MKSKSRMNKGIVLILLGVIGILANLNSINEDFIVLIIAGIFLIGYFMCGGRKYYKNIGLLIPAVILPIAQLCDWLEDSYTIHNLQGTTCCFLLAGAFLLIYFVHSFWYKEVRFGKRNWPLIVSVILFISSGLSYTIEAMNWEFGKIILDNMWPVVLIGIGIMMIIKNYNGKRNRNR